LERNQKVAKREKELNSPKNAKKKKSKQRKSRVEKIKKPKEKKPFLFLHTTCIYHLISSSNHRRVKPQTTLNKTPTDHH
jgi:hypothetical protein